MSNSITEKRVNWLSLLTIWFGGIVSVPALLIGSTFITGLTFYQGILAGLIGYSIVCAFMCFISVAAVNKRLSTVQLATSSFGNIGAGILVGLVIGVSTMGWFGVQSNIAGASFSKIMDLYFHIKISPSFSSVFWGLLMMLTAVFGFKYMRYFNYVAVPCKILIIIFGVYISFQGKSFSSITTFQPTGTPFSILTGIGMAIGLISVGGVISADYSRFAISRKDAILGSILGLIPAALSMLAIGSMLAILQNTSDIVEVFSRLGFPALALMVLIIATWTSNIMNAYSSGLALNQLFRWPEKKRYISTIIAGVIGTALAAIGILEKFTGFLIVLTTAVPPVAGVLIADYWVSKTFNANTTKAFNWKGFAAWALGVLVMILMENTIKNVLGIIVSLTAYWIFQVAFKEKQEEYPEKENTEI